MEMEEVSKRISRANSLLVPYAVPLQGLLGRAFRDPEDAYRFPFQRDRDRIIHTQAFRRLQGKTQVFVAGEGDHYRTRLTHTMEVAQLSRDIARTLRLNEDLAECIALAHDLGHPPFGHAGEDALDAWMKTFGKSFDHNRQSERIVTVIEKHSSLYEGLNLNREVTEGMRKHSGSSLSLEAQLVNIADEIAYTGHDCDDGLQAGLFVIGDLQDLSLIKDAVMKIKDRGTSLRGSVIQMLVTDLYEETGRRLADFSQATVEDIYAAPAPIVSLSETMQERLEELRAFLWQHMYLHPNVTKHSARGQKILEELCSTYHEHPPEKILLLQQRTGSDLQDAIKDYVAGMTDAYAMAQVR